MKVIIISVCYENSTEIVSVPYGVYIVHSLFKRVWMCLHVYSRWNVTK